MTNQDNRAKALTEFYFAPDDALFDQKIIALVLGCSTAKLERDAWAGTGIPFIKINRMRRYRKRTTVDWINENSEQNSTSESRNTKI